ncbi:MAG: sigma-54 dependent transcriptional regulator [Deltaproteobacteria bacterium]|jgi:two-component system NtrC family response regulator|nr:sigma-54 dependent transcriptional regulator [Deltaproteobacteria bacterium]
MPLFLSVGLNGDAREKLDGLGRTLGHGVVHSNNCEESLELLNGRCCAIVIYSLRADRKDSWPATRALVHLPGAPDILAVVDENDTEGAEYAVQSGSWDILYLPFSVNTLKTSLSRCLYHRLALHARDNIDNIKRVGIIGNSPLLERCLRQMSLVAASGSNVLILGETGTGKELFAKAVHENSSRAGHPLIVVDCTNLPATLAESILFGHAKGSFTGAVESTDGLFKQADKGSIFLDEIGELDLNIQKSLLRVIQERRFRPLSAKKEVECDFRIIAATNRDLEAMVREGTFRQDLYHRITTRIIVLPSLRDRKEDIPMLVGHYTKSICAGLKCDPKEMDEETVEAFKLYPWPGNIRELINVIHATVLNGVAEQRLYPQHLPEEVRLFLIRSKVTSRDLGHQAAPHRMTREPELPQIENVAEKEADVSVEGRPPSYRSYSALPTIKQAREEVIRQMERAYLGELIRRCNGDFNEALRVSGLSRARLYELLQKHELNI